MNDNIDEIYDTRAEVIRLFKELGPTKGNIIFVDGGRATQEQVDSYVSKDFRLNNER
jgi:hypothetical protein